jgi:ribosome-binding protein aMBF1 (putative translation factor)
MSELDSDAKVDMQARFQQLEIAAGRMLREARESKGLTVAALAASLKVSVK